jgi:hypothetical protein
MTRVVEFKGGDGFTQSVVAVANKLKVSSGEVRATIVKELKQRRLGESIIGQEYVKELIKSTSGR